MKRWKKKAERKDHEENNGEKRKGKDEQKRNGETLQ